MYYFYSKFKGEQNYMKFRSIYGIFIDVNAVLLKLYINSRWRSFFFKMAENPPWNFLGISHSQTHSPFPVVWFHAVFLKVKQTAFFELIALD
jgi:hypothetical protein